MKLLNNIKLSVFIKEDEDEERLTQVLKSLVPFDLEEEKIGVKKINATGFGEKKIIIAEINLEKERHNKEFLRRLNELLSEEQKELLKRQAESRLDESFNFFIRFDKEKLLNHEHLKITDCGHCFHIKMNIACFPRKREKAMEIIQNIFK